jgi:hypothetical protein
MSLLFIYNLPSEKALPSSASNVFNASQPTTTNNTSGSTNATGALSENVTSSFGNATVGLQNATVGLANATKAYKTFPIFLLPHE